MTINHIHYQSFRISLKTTIIFQTTIMQHNRNCSTDLACWKIPPLKNWNHMNNIKHFPKRRCSSLPQTSLTTIGTLAKGAITWWKTDNWWWRENVDLTTGNCHENLGKICESMENVGILEDVWYDSHVWFVSIGLGALESIEHIRCCKIDDINLGLRCFHPGLESSRGWFVTISFTTIGGSMWITHFWECNTKNVWNNQPNDVLLHGMCLCVCVYIHVQLFWTHLAFKHTTHHPFACLNSSQGTDQEWHDVVQKAWRAGCSCWFRDVWLMVMDTSDTPLRGFQPFCWLKSVETLRKMPKWKLVMSDMGLTAWLWAEPTDRHGACQSWETWTRLSPFESVMLCVCEGAQDYELNKMVW